MSITIIIPPAASNPRPSRRRRALGRAKNYKNRPRSPASSYSSSGSTASQGRADSCARWDVNKKIKNPISSSSKSSSSMSSSADRWDAHKNIKARDALPDAESHTGDKEDRTTAMEETAAPRRTHPVFSGPSFVVASPEPSTLPMPAFVFPRRAGTGMTVPLPASVKAH
ncbi:hypothetical protein BRADI_4g44151v3 [Brachypodium distachyon]|uniref:Uncharacterized protein n=1 Tax=Brachypodium distachyon TaxID=15368 RepID=A0A0Q3EYQ7_BRADI|nr:hypothetical protein BRADI_4g44151v3 [Brachypodium distachyon]